MDLCGSRYSCCTRCIATDGPGERRLRTLQSG